MHSSMQPIYRLHHNDVGKVDEHQRCTARRLPASATEFGLAALALTGLPCNIVLPGKAYNRAREEYRPIGTQTDEPSIWVQDLH